jgi:hypothetical protein
MTPVPHPGQTIFLPGDSTAAARSPNVPARSRSEHGQGSAIRLSFGSMHPEHRRIVRTLVPFTAAADTRPAELKPAIELATSGDLARTAAAPVLI